MDRGVRKSALGNRRIVGVVRATSLPFGVRYRTICHLLGSVANAAASLHCALLLHDDTQFSIPSNNHESASCIGEAWLGIISSPQLRYHHGKSVFLRLRSRLPAFQAHSSDTALSSPHALGALQSMS